MSKTPWKQIEQPQKVGKSMKPPTKSKAGNEKAMMGPMPGSPGKKKVKPQKG